MEKNEILVIYGDNPMEMAEKISEACRLEELIGDRSKRIGLKPNLVVSRPASEGATTHPEIAFGIISYLKKNGFNNIAILEGSWVGDSTTRAFSACGYKHLAEKYDVELIDTQKDSCQTIDCKGLKIEICQSALELDFMINLPVFKGHCQTLLTCALKNNKGIISDSEKRRFHSLGLDKPIAHLNSAIRNDLIVVDGICGDLDFEEGGNPVYGGRIFAARDPVLCDAWASELMGYNTDDIPYISLAEKLGVGSTGPAMIRELNKCPEGRSLSDCFHGPPVPKPSGKIKLLSKFIHEESACSACYSSLVFALSRMGRIEQEKLGRVGIGQGFKGVKDSVGIGQCTSDFEYFCPGCPPTGKEVLSFLREQLKRQKDNYPLTII